MGVRGGGGGGWGGGAAGPAVGLHTYLEGVGGEEGSDLGDDGATHATQHNGVTLVKDTIDQNHINGGTQALNHFHLQHCALRLTDDHQP